MRISTDASSETVSARTPAESKEELSDVHEDVSDAGVTFNDEDMTDENEESLSFESGEKEDA